MYTEQKINWLKRYVANEMELQRLRLEMQRWRSLAERATINISLTGHSSSGINDTTQKAVEAIDKMQNQLLEEIERRVVLRQEIGIAIDTLKDERQSVLLRLRYIDGKTLEQASEIMHYSYRQICRLHTNAINELDIA